MSPLPPPAGCPFRILGGPRCAPPGAQFKKLCNTCPGMRSRLFALASERPGCVAAFQWRPSPAPAASGHTHRGWSATFQKDLCAYCIQPGSCPPTLERIQGACSRMQAQDTSQFCSGSVVCPVSPSARALARQWAPAQVSYTYHVEQRSCPAAPARSRHLRVSTHRSWARCQAFAVAYTYLVEQ